MSGKREIKREIVSQRERTKEKKIRQEEEQTDCREGWGEQEVEKSTAFVKVW